MGIINLVTGLFLIATGFLVKAYPNLIAGYNTMSAERKKKVDIDGLSTFMRNALIMMGSILILGYYFFIWLGFQDIANSVLLIVPLVGTIIMVMMAQKYDHNKKADL